MANHKKGVPFPWLILCSANASPLCAEFTFNLFFFFAFRPDLGYATQGFPPRKKKHGIKRKHEEFVVLFRNPDSFSGSPDKKSVIPIVTAANSDKKFA